MPRLMEQVKSFRSVAGDWKIFTTEMTSVFEDV